MNKRNNTSMKNVFVAKNNEKLLSLCFWPQQNQYAPIKNRFNLFNTDKKPIRNKKGDMFVNKAKLTPNFPSITRGHLEGKLWVP